MSKKIIFVITTSLLMLALVVSSGSSVLAQTTTSTTTPGIPDTGAGGDVFTNLVVLLASLGIAVLGVTYLRTHRSM